MAFQYCTECGHKMTFTINKPKFCSGCGVPLGQEAQASVRPQSSKPLNNTATPSYEEDSTSDQLPNIGRLEYDIEVEGGAMKLGDVIGTSKAGVNPAVNRVANANVTPKSQKQIIAESTAECGSSRFKNTDA